MKKLILALLVICLLASCTDFNSEDLESQGTASIRFGRIVAKSASVSGSVADSSDLYWTYKATKADTGINAGNTNGEFVAVSTEKGLNTTISGFAPGKWTFEIRGYVSNDYQAANLIYSSDPTTATLVRNTITNVAFTVGVTDGSKGKIETQKPATVKIGNVMSSEYTVTCTGEYQGTDGTYSIEETSNTTITNVKQGIWKLTYNFKDKAEKPNDLGSCSVTALVMNGATTKITLTYDDSTASKFQAEAKMPTIINDRGSIKTNLTGTTLEESTVTVKGTSTTGATCEFTVGSEAEGNIKQGIWTLKYTFNDAASNDLGSCTVQALILNGATTTVTLTYEEDTGSFKAQVNIPGIGDWTSVSYKVGDTGPAGGYIFYKADAVQTSTYVDSDGNTVEYQWQYLEAAPADVSTSKVIFGYYRPSGTNTTVQSNLDTSITKDNHSTYNGNAAVGQGRLNTSLLVNAMGSSAYSSDSGTNTTDTYAAKLCDDYTYGGYNDWFLPSIEELRYIYENLCSKSIGTWSASYWSSTEFSGSYSWRYNFKSDNVSNYYRDYLYVRAIRAF